MKQIPFSMRPAHQFPKTTDSNADDRIGGQHLFLTKPATLQVQLFDTRTEGEEEGGAGTREVFPDMDLVWLEPHQIAPFHSFHTKCFEWQSYLPSAAHPKCLVLSKPLAAVPRWPLEDERCPVLTLATMLESRGWKMSRGLVNHTDGTLVYDSRSATRMRWYYRLLALSPVVVCVGLAGGSMPSQQPMAFYRLLMVGVAVGPGHDNKYYLRLLNKKRTDEGQPAIEDDPAPAPVPKVIHGGPLAVPLEGAPPPGPKRARDGGRGPIRPAKAKAGAKAPVPTAPPPLPPPPGPEPGPVPVGVGGGGPSPIPGPPVAHPGVVLPPWKIPPRTPRLLRSPERSRSQVHT